MKFKPRGYTVAIITAVILAAQANWATAQNSSRSQEPTANDESIPPAPTHYKGRQIARTMSYHGASWLIRESRAREEGSEKLLQALELKPGQVVADIGAGNGYYSLRIAKLIGKTGRVLAVDIQPEMLKLLKLRAESEGIENVEPILSTLIDPKLPADSCDTILLVDVYHEFSHPEHVLRGLRASLKPEGRLVLVEFRTEDPNVPIKPLHKMSKEQMLKELPPNGFRLVKQFDELPWQHVMFFQRDELPGDGDSGAP